MKNRIMSRKFKYRCTLLGGTIFVIMSIIFMIVVLVKIVISPELFSSQELYHMRRNLENGDSETIAFYRTKYTDKGIYLFEDPTSFEIMSEETGMSVDDLHLIYNYKNMTSAQELYNFIKEQKW